MKNSLIKYFKTYYPYLLTFLLVIGILQTNYKNDQLLISYEFEMVLNDIKDEFKVEAEIENKKKKRYFENGRRKYLLSKWDSTLNRLDINYYSTYYSEEEFFKIIQAFKSDVRIKNLLNKYPIKNNNFEYNFPIKSLPLTVAFSLLFVTILVLLFSTVSFLNKNWTITRTMEITSIVLIVFFLIAAINNLS